MFSFYIDADLRRGLKAIRDRDGISESEQIRRAIRAWLTSKGEMKAAPHKRSRKEGRKRR